MAEGRSSRRTGTTGIVVIVALAAIAGAWLVTTFSSSIASAAQSTQERVARIFMSDEEEIEQAVRDYIEAYNYEGSDGAQWRQQMENTVIPEEYYASSTGEEFRETAEAVSEVSREGYSTRIESELEQWQLDEHTDESARGSFAYQTSYDVLNDGEEPEQIQGRTEVRLSNTDDGWKVTSAEEISNQDSQGSSGEAGNGEEGATTGSQEVTEETEGTEEDAGGETTAASSEDSEEEIAQTIDSHYRAIGENDFEEAYSYFGPGFQSENNEESWVEEEESYDIQSSTVHSIDVTEADEETATAEVDVSFEDNTGNPRFEVTWDLVRQGGEWKLNEYVSGREVE